MTKKFKKNTKSNIKKIFFLLTALIISYQTAKLIFKPNLSQYPKLNSCFKTTVYKINLCPSSGNYTPINNIAKHFIHSVLVSEDDSFYIHEGVDWNEFKKSFVQNLKLMRFARGGSTITQQLVKNVYLTKNKSLIRKFKEILLAQQIEDKYPKSLILEKYLNVIELGNNIYGIKQAARYYFKKPPAQLNLLESVYLTTLLPNPKIYSQSFYRKKLPHWQAQRIKKILNRLARRNKISKDLYSSAVSKIDLFPWENIDLIETQKHDNDNLDFLNNIKTEQLDNFKFEEPSSNDDILTDPIEEETNITTDESDADRDSMSDTIIESPATEPLDSDVKNEY